MRVLQARLDSSQEKLAGWCTEAQREIKVEACEIAHREICTRSTIYEVMFWGLLYRTLRILNSHRNQQLPSVPYGSINSAWGLNLLKRSAKFSLFRQAYSDRSSYLDHLVYICTRGFGTTHRYGSCGISTETPGYIGHDHWHYGSYLA